MIDIVSPDVRKRMMSGIRNKDTRSELVIRHALHRKGFRYRIHPKTIPGKPDLVLPKHRVVVFVNGCFWHGHGCHMFKWPTTRPNFWRDKIGNNRIRDQRVSQLLSANGWRVLTIWECAIRGTAKIEADQLTALIVDWINSDRADFAIAGRNLPDRRPND